MHYLRTDVCVCDLLYAIGKVAKSFEMVQKTLAKDAGLTAMEIISFLYAEHVKGNAKVGINSEEGTGKDVSATNVRDLYITKSFTSKYASDAACTVLRVDQSARNGKTSCRLKDGTAARIWIRTNALNSI
ncbi:hypothetical protein BT93_K1380 [Corymbia citriodora subsp. variegata]|nr:hypothetical protein BT93_K1380 [Corymbia citriodora subsp. variegata]